MKDQAPTNKAHLYLTVRANKTVRPPESSLLRRRGRTEGNHFQCLVEANVARHASPKPTLGFGRRGVWRMCHPLVRGFLQHRVQIAKSACRQHRRPQVPAGHKQPNKMHVGFSFGFGFNHSTPKMPKYLLLKPKPQIETETKPTYETET